MASITNHILRPGAVVMLIGGVALGVTYHGDGQVNGMTATLATTVVFIGMLLVFCGGLSALQSKRTE
jgi:flavin reductase (DIM6/NTAB) family NADH-FMN oxidoreductase RutF